MIGTARACWLDVKGYPASAKHISLQGAEYPAQSKHRALSNTPCCVLVSSVGSTLHGEYLFSRNSLPYVIEFALNRLVCSVGAHYESLVSILRDLLFLATLQESDDPTERNSCQMLSPSIAAHHGFIRFCSSL